MTAYQLRKACKIALHGRAKTTFRALRLCAYYRQGALDGILVEKEGFMVLVWCRRNGTTHYSPYLGMTQDIGDLLRVTNRRMEVGR